MKLTTRAIGFVSPFFSLCPPQLELSKRCQLPTFSTWSAEPVAAIGFLGWDAGKKAKGGESTE